MIWYRIIFKRKVRLEEKENEKRRKGENKTDQRKPIAEFIVLPHLF